MFLGRQLFAFTLNTATNQYTHNQTFKLHFTVLKDLAMNMAAYQCFDVLSYFVVKLNTIIICSITTIQLMLEHSNQNECF